MAPSPTSVLPATSSSSGRHTFGPGAKTSPRRASITGRPSPYASSVDAPATRTSSASDSARATARPMRMLVKLPGPRPTTMPSMVAGSSTRRSTATRTSPARSARSRAPVETPQTAPNEVAVSKAKITVDPHAPVRLVDVPESNDGARLGQPVPSVLGPFDEGDRAVEVRLEVTPLLGIEPGDPVQVEMRDRRRRLVPVPDRERRARNGPAHTQGARGSSDERRLPRAELARDRHD